MSLSIDTIENATVFLTTPTALVSPINYSDTAFGVTTTYLYNIGIPLSVSNVIISTLNFTSNVICNTITGYNDVISFLGNVTLGHSGGTTTFYGTNPFVTGFPYWVSSSGINRKMFAGVYTGLNNATIAYPTANFFNTNSVVINTATDNRNMGNIGSNLVQSTLRFNPTGGTRTCNSIIVGS